LNLEANNDEQWPAGERFQKYVLRLGSYLAI